MSFANNKITIRRVTQMDLSTIANMQVKVLQADQSLPLDPALIHFFAHEFEKRWTKQLEQNFHILVMLENDRLIGFASFLIDDDKQVEIKTIYLLPSCRQLGYGKKFWEAILTEISSVTITAFYTWILADNEIAKLFYESLNFKLTNNTRIDGENEMALKEIELRLEMPQILAEVG